MEHPPPPKPLDHEATKPKPLLPLSFANGVLKKHHQRLPPQPPLLPPAATASAVQQPTSPSTQDQQRFVYRECLKNHAAALGGHALDGCGEFMPSPDSNPSDPTSLTCAACGCHRNFHRRLHCGFLKYQHQHHRDSEEREEDDDEEQEQQEEGGDHSSPTQYYSAPHMLLALSGGLAGGIAGEAGADPSRTITTATTGMTTAGPLATGSATVLPRKRFRSKFSTYQKEKMYELSERLGWRMQKRDEGLVEECCKEIGVGKGVFKVWMHNNKHNFCASTSSRRAESAAPAPAGGVVNIEGVEGIGDGRNGHNNIAIGNGRNNDNGNISQVVNAASSSS